MLISKKRKFVFIHIPKTAGTSISVLLKNRYKRDVVENMKTHVHARHIIQHLEEQGENWQHYFFFSFVRNPFERLHSLYHFIQARWPEKVKGLDLNDWLQSNNDTYDGRQTPPNETAVPNTRKPQLDWLTTQQIRSGDGLLPKIIPSYIGRFEDLEYELKQILMITDDDMSYRRRVNPDQRAITDEVKWHLPRLQNYNRDKDYRKYYSAEGRAWVEKYFEVDLDYFGYSF